MKSVGVVREWDRDEGWGVVDSQETPGGCWVHFSDVAGEGYRELTAGQLVTLRWERFDQDGYAYRAVKVWEPGAEPPDAVTSEGTAMRSTLTIVFDQDPEDEQHASQGG